GSFGVVYVGLFRKTVPVAVKKFKAEINACILKAFTKEVTAWEGLVQKNVLPLMAYCIDPPMLVTDLMEQGNLRQYLHSRSWDQSIGLKLLHDVASGMAYLHAHGIVHGDLKAVNVMVDENKALIADFGLAKVRQEIGMTTSSTHGLAGTLVFMAPELLNGDPPQRPADVYAFAMTCYEVLSKGRYPFVDVPNPAVLIYQVGSLKRRPQRPEGVDDKIWALVERCWSHFAEDRP
ncbi:kinase-like domain-containing protein, partial [Hyaloraphidium curvatum]